MFAELESLTFCLQVTSLPLPCLATVAEGETYVDEAVQYCKNNMNHCEFYSVVVALEAQTFTK